MGILTRAFDRGEKRGVTIDPQLWRSIMASSSASGVTITQSSALTIGAVFACVRVLSETLASLPLHVNERLEGDDRRRARDHALYPVLHSIANPEMSSFSLREILQAHVLTWGNGYAEIESSQGGDVIALWPLRPDKTNPARRGGILGYDTELPKSAGGGSKWLMADRVFHVHGLGFDGLSGYSVIKLFRDALGLTKATEIHGGKFFANGARPGGLLKHPGILSENAQERLRSTWYETHGGLDKSQRLAILEEGMEFEAIGIPPDDAQFLETREFQTTEIARIFRVPPHMIGDLTRATFSNIEQQAIDFVVNSIGPWLVRWEQEIYRQLLTAPERLRYYAEFLVAGLLRGDTEARFGSYAIGKNNGWLSANDIRRLENMNSIGPAGDVYMVPLNMVPAEQAGDFGGNDRALLSPGALGGASGRREPNGPEAEGAEVRNAAAVARGRLSVAWGRQYSEAAGRVVRREANDITNGARRFKSAGAVAGFYNWLDNFYLDHVGYVRAQFRPIAWSYGDMIAVSVADEVGDRALGAAEIRELPASAEGFAETYVDAFVDRHNARSKDRVHETVQKAIANGEPWFAALEAEFDQEREKRPAIIAAEETIRFNNALALALYVGLGVGWVVWRAIGKSCPYCKKLNGRRVRARIPFLSGGESFHPEGADRPLKVTRKILHAPAHKGCDCMITAG